MFKPGERIRLIAATPIEVGERRLLPSVLVSRWEYNVGDAVRVHTLNIRPVSIVEESPDGTRWHAIPNATSDILSVMAAIGLSVAAVSLLILGLTAVLRGR